jgi:hypothetical protein
MKNQTMWLLAGAGVVAYLMMQQQTSSTVSRVRFRPYSPPHTMKGIPGGTGGYAEQGQGFGMGNRARYGYDG